jgi:hypothetical protein
MRRARLAISKKSLWMSQKNDSRGAVVDLGPRNARSTYVKPSASVNASSAPPSSRPRECGAGNRILFQAARTSRPRAVDDQTQREARSGSTTRAAMPP